jgi:hypothetical protein
VLGEITFVRKRHKFGGTKGQSPFPSIVVRFTAKTIRAGRQRQKRGDHTLCTLVDKSSAAKPTLPARRFWLTPLGMWEDLRRVRPDITDVFPHPPQEGYDAFTVKWPDPSYANLPFKCADELHGRSLLDGVREAIRQNREFGTEIYVPVPSTDPINLLLQAGAIGRSLGRLPWLDVDTKEPCPNPGASALFVLRSRNVP